MINNIIISIQQDHQSGHDGPSDPCGPECILVPLYDMLEEEQVICWGHNPHPPPHQSPSQVPRM